MLAAGSRLGPYTILAPLGAGGMGEVYRARDPRLGREVAVKVLPAAVSGDGDRLRRFEQEARAASALNHPNILTVFDTGSQDGTVYLVTEVLEGETLRGRLAGGALPARKAIEIGIQIARGLAAAHEKGIIHRDIKPENLFLTRDDRVKILDFGLAKLRQSDIADAPTILTGTEPEVVLGTVGYMAPEQVRGQPADHRADVFALGAVLYEMLTGRRAFHKNSAAETLAAILRAEPPELAVPPGLERVVRHCLEKDPHHRFQSASDLAFGLESVSAVSVPSAPPGRRRSLLRPAAVAGLLLLTAVLVGVLIQQRLGRSEPPYFRRLTFRNGNVIAARFAPDGQTIVYTATWEGGPHQVFTTRTDSPEARSLGLPPALLQSISPGGEMLIDLIRERDGTILGSTLARAPLAGGAPRAIQEESRTHWADWAPDGRSFALLAEDDRGWRIEYPRGRVIWRSEGYAWGLRVAPSGDALAFCETRSDARQTVIILDRAGKVIARSGSWNLPLLSPVWSPAGCVAWAPGGKEVWFTAARPGSESGLYALTHGSEVRPLVSVPGALALLDIDREGRALRGTDGSPAVRLGDGWALALSPNGRWALARSATETNRLFLLPTGAGEEKALPPISVRVAGASWLPGGKQLLIEGAEPGKGERLYILDVGAKEARPVTREGIIRSHVLSPDGSRVATQGLGGVRLHPIGGGEPRPVPSVPALGEWPVQWRADGRALYMGRRGRGGYYWIDEVDLATGRRARWKELRLPDAAGGGIRFVKMTPDGKAYAYNAWRSLSTLYLVEGLR